MSEFGNNNALASLFGNARSPMPSTSTGSHLHHHSSFTRSVSAEVPSVPSTPRARNSGKRAPRRSANSFSSSTTSAQTPNRKMSSVSPCDIASSSSRTPSSRHSHRQSGTASPFAGAKFSDSPSARAIPLPPTIWFEDEEDSVMSCGPSDTESLTSDSSSSTSSGDASMSSSSPSITRGIRVNPLQLIEAVAAM